MTNELPPPARRDVLVPAAVGIAVVVAFVLIYPVRGYRIPLGSDTPVYVWWARLAGTVGLGSFQTGTRPGIVGLLATLAHLTGRPVAGTAEALTPALAAALALAAAVVTTSGFGRTMSRFVLVGLSVGTFLSFMVSGYESTVAFGAFFLAAMAVVVEGLGDAPARSTVAGAALVAVAGLVHPLFLAFAAPLVVGAGVALLPSWRRDRRSGIPAVRTAIGRLAVASAGGLTVAAAGLMASGAGGGPPADTSRDAVLRRTGLRQALRMSYVRKLRHDFPWWRAALLLIGVQVALVPGALASLAPREEPPDQVAGPGHVAIDRRQLIAGLGVAWIAVTIGGVAALFAGVLVPGQRLADFCLPLPILTALGLAAALRRGRGRTVRALATAGVVGFLALTLLPWWSGIPLVTDRQAGQAHLVGIIAGIQPAGTPLVVVMDDRSDKPGLFVTRYVNLIRDEVPAARIGDVHLFLGTPADLLAGRPTLSGLPEHDRMAIDAWQGVAPVLARRPLIVVVEGFDAAGYRQAVTTPGARLAGPGVAELPPIPGCLPCLPGPGDRPGSGPLSPWAPLWLGPLLLGAFAVVGWPWIRLALPAASPATAVALAPASGAGALALASVAADAVGARLAGPGAWLAVAVALTGWVAFVVGARDGRPRRQPGAEPVRPLRGSASAPTPDSP